MLLRELLSRLRRPSLHLLNQLLSLLLPLHHPLVAFLFLLSHMRLIRDDQSIQFLVRLHTKQLVLLSLSEMEQFLDLLLLPHLSLLLLLLQIMFLEPALFKFSLFAFVGAEPFGELDVVLAVGSLVDRDHEHSCWEESEDRLARFCELLRADRASERRGAQMAEVGVPIEMRFLVRCQVGRLGKSF